MSDPKAVLHAAVDAVESGGYAYLIYGGLAAGIWGEPRYTEDVDLVLFVPERDAYKFLREAEKHGFAVDEDLALQQIQVNGWARLPFGRKDSPWHLDLTLGDTPFDESALKRRREVTLFERHVWVASPEDLILYKLIAGRDQDKVDVRHIGIRQAALDSAYLRTWAEWWEREGVAGIRAGIDQVLGQS